ncbi:MFS transporter [uncultured Sulfitobacter sp.]|uniref:MFS transporter n=1 Tax=uncultured Sulfitobacter sp. TaxID=191468 RepID=UPI00261F3E04|nr:MFS transporter [uncultured Sulfitobacter sp.]
MRVERNIRLIPWYRLFDSLLFWQAIWFLYFQANLSGAEAIFLYSVYDISTTVLEVPSGYFSDRVGRRRTLVISAAFGVLGCLAIAFGGSFAVFALGQSLLGASTAFKSGTDTSLMFESLTAAGRAREVEAQEVRVWRFSLAGFAMSAVSGGALAMWFPAAPFFASAAAFGIAVALTWRMVEPERHTTDEAQSLPELLRTLRAALRHPVLAWLFALAVLMYGFSHLPFIFGQPFILRALEDVGLGAQTPLVSGAVTSVMMLVSAAASVVAVRLRKAAGLPLILLGAFALQIGLAGTLAMTTSVLAIGILFLRMVPDSLATPFITARIQPLLTDSSRATYLSLQSLAGKLAFAATLIFAASGAARAGLLPTEDLQRILAVYCIGGLVCLGLLAFTSRGIALEPGAQKTE